MAKILRKLKEYCSKHFYSSFLTGSLIFGSLLDLGTNSWTYFVDRKPYAELQSLPDRIGVVKSDLRQEDIPNFAKDLDSFYESFNIALTHGSNGFRRDVKAIIKPLDNLLAESRSITIDKSYRTSLYDPKFREKLEDVLNQTEANCINYNGELDGKFHYYHFGLAILGSSVLMGILLHQGLTKIVNKEILSKKNGK